MYYPRTLVLSNNSFSRSNSNGRTLGNLFHGWPKDRLAQFAIMCIDPDFDLCDNYYQVKDAEVLRALLKGESAVTGTAVTRESVRSAQCYGKSGMKTAWRMLLRNAAWNCRRWLGTRFKTWLESFDPEVVVVQSGDSAFMLSLANRIAKQRGIPLVIYNTEGYLFFDHNFMRPHWSDPVAFPLFRKHYRCVFQRTLAYSSYSVYLNSKLRDDYMSFMPHKCTVIYNSSNLSFQPKDALSRPPRISYLGNLGIRRTEALAEVGTVLQSISPEFHIDVYGEADAEKIYYLEQSPGVCYRGTVPYTDVVKIIRQSDIIFHVEKNDPILCRELRYAFSTKIADSICSGTDFVIYAPSNLACSQYVINTKAAWLADSPSRLRNVICQILDSDSKKRIGVLENASKASHLHNLEANAEAFRQILADTSTNSRYA